MCQLWLAQGVVRISSDRDDRMGGGGGGGGIKTPKNPWTKNLTPKNPMPDFWAWKISKKQLNDKTQQVWLYVILRTMDTWANKPQIFFFWIPKKSLLKSSHPKKYLPNCTKKILELKISNPNRPFLSLKIWSNPPPPPIPGTASLVSHANSAENAVWQCYFHIRSWPHTPWAVESSWSCGDYHGIQLSLRCIWLE